MSGHKYIMKIIKFLLSIARPAAACQKSKTGCSTVCKHLIEAITKDIKTNTIQTYKQTYIQN